MKCSLGISNFLKEISSLSQSIVFLYWGLRLKKKKKDPYQILLLIANAPGHPKALTEMYKISVTFMYANTTSILVAHGSRSIFTFQVLLFKKYTL